ncbi:hypothetical protein G4X40_09175 [Rhodococcus sp. D2-41]|uniref:zeta toxin family protein n=1 Tax=Speluncibacter jeojiensis TaxID=2710754 RepID=UPI00240F1ACC|nr:zeta toxin family protein [Rhodococcus sp. D2-41]MDG3010323.1 hypothetical protein [Rhodococcus sp. D2-41]
MAGLVHHESIRLIDQIRRICIAQRENIVVEGTLSWRGQAPRLVTELAQGDYQRVEVIAIDADRTTCHEQALARWWRGRRRWVGGTDLLGGRFTPPAAIDICFTDTELSRCAQHAVELAELASAAVGDTHVTILRGSATGEWETILNRTRPDSSTS